MVSRQRQWQKKQQAAGRCVNCGRRREHYRSLCDPCTLRARIRMRKRTGCRPHRDGGTGAAGPGEGRLMIDDEADQERAERKAMALRLGYLPGDGAGAVRWIGKGPRPKPAAVIRGSLLEEQRQASKKAHR